MVKNPDYDRYAGIKSLPGPDGKMPRPFRVDENWNVIYLDEGRNAVLAEGQRDAGDRAGIMSWDELDRKLDEERDTIRRLGAEKPVQLAEAPNPSWNGYEVLHAQGQRDGQRLKQTTQAADAFRRNFRDMVEANTKGADKYFHCKANSEASSLGQYGEDAAENLSDVRELFGQVVKGDPVVDSMEDQRANVAGRRAGRDLRDGQVHGADHRKACAPFRPRSLGRRY